MADKSNNRKSNPRIGLQGDWDGVLWGKGCPPPTVEMPPRPIRINFTAEEIRRRLQIADGQDPAS